MNKLIRNSTAKFLIFISQNGEDSNKNSVSRDFRHTQKALKDAK